MDRHKFHKYLESVGVDTGRAYAITYHPETMTHEDFVMLGNLALEEMDVIQGHLNKLYPLDRK